MEITLQGEFTDLNTYINAERTNRFKAASIKKSETNRVIWECKGIDEKITTPFTVHIHWIVPNARKDPDNIAFAKKFILDGLVKAEIIPADTQRFVKGFTDTYSIGEPCVVVTLEPR